MFRKVQQAVGDFIESAEMDVHCLQKLKLFDTDILKFCNVAMRMCQYLEHRFANPRREPGDASARKAHSLYESAYALYAWKRQLHLHFAFYKSPAAART